jgi:hypothetical protein
MCTSTRTGGALRPAGARLKAMLTDRAAPRFAT